MPLHLHVLPETFAVCRLHPSAALPGWAQEGPFFSITRTRDELSIVCLQSSVLQEAQPAMACEPNWRAFKVVGPLDFSLIGILAGLTRTLAEAGVSVFAVSTYDTDYILVSEANLPDARQALTAAGHQVEG
jgi:uncharacterized protein